MQLLYGIRKIRMVKKIILNGNHKKIDKSFGYVVGTYLSDGWIGNESVIGLTVKDKDFALEFKKNLENWSGLKTKYSEHDGWGNAKGKYYRVAIYSVMAARFLRKFINERFNVIYKFNSEIKGIILRGMFDGDGWATIHEGKTRKTNVRMIGFTNIEKRNSMLIHNILNEFGIKNSIRENNHSGFNSKKINYVISITGKTNFEKFNEKIGFTIKRKKDKLNKILNSYKKKLSIEEKIERTKKYNKEYYYLNRKKILQQKKEYDKNRRKF